MMAPDQRCLRALIDRDGAAILDVEHGQISMLNSAGGHIWQCLERGETPETIVANLVRETGADPLVVKCDVEEFLLTLKENFLLPADAEVANDR